MADQIKQCSDPMSEHCLNVISGSAYIIYHTAGNFEGAKYWCIAIFIVTGCFKFGKYTINGHLDLACASWLKQWSCIFVNDIQIVKC